MDSETTLRALFLALTAMNYGIRLAYERRVPKTKATMGVLEVALIVTMCAWAASMFTYPWKFAWFEHPLGVPLWARWVGIACMGASMPLSVWIYRALGVQFLTKLSLTDDHYLVVGGPYRFVRHPMYATFCLCAAGAALAASNVILVVTSLCPAIIMLVRIKREEAMLIGRFGDLYREYMRKTAAVVPGLL